MERKMWRQRRRGSGVKWLKHYSSAQSILVVGDGDMSFSLALAAAFGSGENLVATSLDSYDTLTSKYGKAESNVIELEWLGATVFHGVDAKMMKHHPCLKMRRFDRIVFNFPHAGFIGQEKKDHVIKAHQLLVRKFFHNASLLLHPDGEIHVSHKTGQPYDRWQIEELASEFSLVISEVVTFRKQDYPGYNQKRGDGEWCDQEFPLLNGCTYKFRVEQRGEADEPCIQKFTAVQMESLHRLQESLDDVTKLHQEKEQQLLLLQQELNSISGSLRSCEHARRTLESRLEEEECRSRKFTTAQMRLRESLDAVTKLHQEKEQQLLVLQQELISISGSLRSCEHARSTLESRLEEEERRNRKFNTAQMESQHRLRESLDAVTKLRQKLLLSQQELTLTSESPRSGEHARSTLGRRLEEEQRRSRKFKVLFWSMCILFLIVVTVKHGVPLMWSKWVHRLLAHQEDEQGQGSRLADGPPHLPHGDQTSTASTTTVKDQGTRRGPLQPGGRRGGPGDPDARQEARLIPGNQPPDKRRGYACQPWLEAARRLGRQEDGGAVGGC